MIADDLDQRLSSLVVSRGLIDSGSFGRVQAYVETRGGSLVHALRDLQLLSRAELLSILQEVTGVEALDPSLISIDPAFQAGTDCLWPPALAAATQTTPIRFIGPALQVAMVEPWSEMTHTALAAFTGCMIVPALMLQEHPAEVTTAQTTAELIAEYWLRRVAIPLASTLTVAAERVSRREPAAVPVEELALSPEIVLAVHAILCRAAATGASDVHLDPDPVRLRIRFRVDGRLRDAAHASPALVPAVIARLRLLGASPAGAGRDLLDAAFTCAVSPTRRVEVRVAVVRALAGERCTLRLVDRDARLPSLADLGMDGPAKRLAAAAAAEPFGLVLVAGPTGSGKTSTLYSLVETRVADDVAVVSVEDPVERRLPGVVQVPCDATSGLGFADVLRALLRQDPDVIMVGEIRDAQTAALAVRGATTGHLILSSVHAGTAAATVQRLLGLDVEPHALASVLRLVISQRLVRRLCRSCRQPVDVPADDWSRAGGGNVGGTRAYAAVGCPACAYSGYQGRVGIFEILRVSAAVREQIAAGASAVDIERATRAEGMATLREAGLSLVATGVTSLAEVISLTRPEEA